MTKQELQKLDASYKLKRLDVMGKLQNKLVKDIAESQMLPQDALMVLVVITRQVEEMFIRNLYPKKEE